MWKIDQGQSFAVILLKKDMDMSLIPDPTFYPSPGMAMQAPPERLVYVALLNTGKNGQRDAMGVIDLDPNSSEYGRLVGIPAPSR